ncbi:MAG: SDR family NAD(P)-dependent oxidoreductase [Elioraea sp.]|nr:SDR family NAD(P)-dependent oxidoreductase [Elioraea sp.]MDW8443649.1 SDR family NAD(P)-dependent oxidoreductase [Acetobacteraceae bacterium]
MALLDGAGRVALITGANRGIGHAIAEALYARGYALSLGMRRPDEAASRFAHMDPARVHRHRFVAEDWEGQARWVEAAVARFGRIDVLVNNAGITSRATVRTATEADCDAIWAVNCKAPLRMAQLCLPHLERSGQGRIVTIASLSGKRVRNDHVLYTMSKFAVVALTHSLRRIGWESGVRAVAICPSFVRTDMTADATAIAREAMTDPADLAELVATVIALPNNASVAELLVNCRLEDMV